jgi:hypothetical protein
MTTDITADNDSYKRQTHPLVREDVPQGQDSNSQREAQHQDRLTDRQSQFDFDFDCDRQHSLFGGRPPSAPTCRHAAKICITWC